LTTLRDTGFPSSDKKNTFGDRFSRQRCFAANPAERQRRLGSEPVEANALGLIVKEPPEPVRIGKGAS
jgi:hypothetical protein